MSDAGKILVELGELRARQEESAARLDEVDVGGVSISGGAVSGRLDGDSTTSANLPFDILAVMSSGSDEPRFVVYCPSGSVIRSGEEVLPGGGFGAGGTIYWQGGGSVDPLFGYDWYSLGSGLSGDVYLNVHLPGDETGNSYFLSSESAAAGGSEDAGDYVSVLIATLGTDFPPVRQAYHGVYVCERSTPPCDADEAEPTSKSVTAEDNPDDGSRRVRLHGFRDGSSTSMPDSDDQDNVDVLVRDSRGSPPELKYIPISQFLAAGGYTGSLTVVESVEWDPTYHKLVKKTRTWAFTNGRLTGVLPNPAASPAAPATVSDIVEFVPEQV